MSSGSNSRRRIAAVAGVAATALVLSACGGSSDSAGEDGVLTIGTTDKITSLDPAGSYDNGSFAVMNQVYPFLLNTPYGSPDVKPDIAESAEFTSPTEYTVKLKPGLKFANGHDLTSSDVKFTFDRQLKIADPNGPASLLANLDSVEAPDATTVVFNLKAANDQTFPQVLLEPGRPDRRRGGLLGRRAHPGRRHRRGQGLRRPVHDRQLRLQQPDPVQGVRRLPGPARRREDRARSTSSTTPTRRT